MTPCTTPSECDSDNALPIAWDIALRVRHGEGVPRLFSDANRVVCRALGLTQISRDAPAMPDVASDPLACSRDRLATR